MSPGLAFLADLFAGATIGVICMGAITANVVAEFRQKLYQERDRRIHAEDQANAQLEDDVRILGEFPPIVEWIPWSGEGEPLK